MSLWLTPEELEELTGYKQRNGQKTALGKMGINFISREKDGYPLVARGQFDSRPDQPTRRREPRLDWLKRA